MLENTKILLVDTHKYITHTVIHRTRPGSHFLEVSPETGGTAPIVDDSPDMEGLQISLDAGEGRLFILGEPADN